MKKSLLILALLFAIPQPASAHCPLCTIGAGFLAVAAASIGVGTAPVGVLVGAFSMALALWLSRLVKKNYIPHQSVILTAIIFLGTVIPIMPFIREYRPFYISLLGEYGSLLHNTYMINLYLLGSAVGAILLFVSPYVSQALINARQGRLLPFQGLGITFGLLVAAALLFQLIL